MNAVRIVRFIGILLLFLISTIAPCGLVIKGEHTVIPGSQPLVLVTGFEPFGKYDVNPSQLIAEALNGTEIDGARIIGIVVPVNFTKSVAVVTQAIEEYHPLIVLCIGLAASSKCVRLENVGLNVKRDPDETGIKRLDPSGPLVRFSSLPSAVIVKELRSSGILVRQSWFAGSYVCNALLYGVLGYITNHTPDTHMGFLHVPLLSSQNPQGMKLQTLINATQIVITVSLQEIE